MTTIITQSRHRSRRLVVGAVVAVLSLTSTACGDDDTDDAIPREEWVAEFDRVCLDVLAQLSAATTEDQFVEISRRAIDEMSELPPPDEMQDEATAMLDAIEEQTTSTVELDQARIDELDQTVLQSGRALGVSAECMGGAMD